jgi:hypothetical protein
MLPSHPASNNTGVIAGAAAAGASILTLILLLCFFWRRRRHQQFDGTFDPDRIAQSGPGHTDIAGTEITTYSYDPQAVAGAGIGHSGYDSEQGVRRAGSGSSGPSAAIWSGESSMRQYPESQTLIMGNVSGMGGGIGTGTSGSRYGPTPSESTSGRPESTTTGHSHSYGSGGGSASMGSTRQQPYRPFSVQEKGQSEMIGRTDGGDEGGAVVEEVGSLQHSDSGQGIPHLRSHPSALAESPFGDVVMIQHSDGGRVPDAAAAASTPHEIPPSYDSIPRNV